MPRELCIDRFLAAHRDRDVRPTSGLLIDVSQLVIREAEPLATHQSKPGLRSQNNCRVDRSGFSEFPLRSSMLANESKSASFSNLAKGAEGFKI